MKLLSWLMRLASPAKRVRITQSRIEPSIAWQRWTAEKLQAVKLELEAIRPEDFSDKDSMRVAEYWIQRYLPSDSVIKTQAQYKQAISAIQKKIADNARLTIEERADAAKQAEQRVSPEFRRWMEQKLAEHRSGRT